MLIETGTYTGDGSVGRTVSTGIALDGADTLLFVMRGDATYASPMAKTDTMVSNVSAFLDGSTSTTNRITALGAATFTVGDANEVNANGVVYYYCAIVADGDPDMKTFSYTGTGSAHDITTPGFAPELVLTFPHQGQAHRSCWRSSLHGAGESHRFEIGMNTGLITGFVATGFSVGTDAIVNQNTHTYHAVAVAPNSQLASFTYTGNGADNRAVGSLAAAPLFGWLQVNDPINIDRYAVLRTTDMGADFSSPCNDFPAGVTNRLQNFNSTGFEVGSSNESNRNTSPYNALAFGTGVTSGSSAPPPGLSLLGVGH